MGLAKIVEHNYGFLRQIRSIFELWLRNMPSTDFFDIVMSTAGLKPRAISSLHIGLMKLFSTSSLG